MHQPNTIVRDPAALAAAFAEIDAAIDAAILPVAIGGDPLFRRCLPPADDLARIESRHHVAKSLPALRPGDVVIGRDGERLVVCDEHYPRVTVTPASAAHWRASSHWSTFWERADNYPLPTWETRNVHRCDVIPTGERIRVDLPHRGARHDWPVLSTTERRRLTAEAEKNPAKRPIAMSATL